MYDVTVVCGNIAPKFCNFFMNPFHRYRHTHLAYNHYDVPQVHTLNLRAGKVNTANSTKFWKCGIFIIIYNYVCEMSIYMEGM